MTATRTAASIAIICLCVYFAFDNHVPMPPWNNLEPAGSQIRSTLTGIVPLVLGLIGLVLRVRWLVAIVAFWALVWFAAQMHQWWLPYLFGPTPLHDDFSWYFQNGYTETLTILSIRDDRPTPDAQHLTLQALSLVVLVLLVRATFAWRCN